MKVILLVVLLVVCSANYVISHHDEPPATPASCQDVLALGNTETGQYEIDPDGPGGEAAFTVLCEMSGVKGWTVISHDADYDNKEDRRVDGCEEAGSFVKKITYKGNNKQILTLLDLSGFCEQFISYEAHASVMYWIPEKKNYAWWKNRHGRAMQNWGGSPTGTHGCGCSTETAGCVEKMHCNADSNTHQLTKDSGYLNDKDNLPVTELRFGDTGTLDDDEYGYYELGPIRCSGGPTHREQEIPFFNTDTIYSYRYDLPRITPGECRIEFEVQACNDAFIGFSEQEGEQAELVELNVGGWQNSKTVFRNCKQCEVECEIKEPILSCEESKRFWVSWCAGTFSFGREGHGQLLTWNPPRSITPTHIAYSTGYGATGKFSFDSFFSKEIYTCQNQKAEINCGSKYINILSAVYGRNAREHCPHRALRSTNCGAMKSLEVVGKQCQGQHKCGVTVNNGVFGNPCCGTYKYLHAKYRCVDIAKPKRFTNDVCENNKCNPAGGQCQPLRGTDYRCSCRANFFGKYCEREYAMCRAWGDPHYTGFNGRNFDYQGRCKYILAAPCVDNGDFLFKVVGVNKVASWNNKVTYNRAMELKIGSSDIVLFQGKNVQIDGAITNAPCSAKDTTIGVDGKFLVVTNERLGVKILWDGNEVVKVFADKGLYGENMCGLCGSIKAQKNDPFIMKNGTTTDNIDAFGESWTANPFECPECKDCFPLSHCKDNPEFLSQAKGACEPIRDAQGYFVVGHDQFDPERMFESCVFDMCSEDKYNDVIRCANLEEYANRIIQENRQDYIRASNLIVEWRTELECPFNCPPGSVYSICASSCQRTCYQTVVRETCDMDCVEGCEPAPGFVLQNGIPVPEDECGCRYGNDYYNVGQEWTTKDCGQYCTCGKGSKLYCFNIWCVRHAFCGSQNAVHGCHCVSNYGGDGKVGCKALCPQFMGDETKVRKQVDEGGHVVILSDFQIICEGYIRSFTVKRTNELLDEVDFLVFRQHPDDLTKFIIVGSAHLTTDDDTMDLSLPDNEKIPVKAGDFVGFMSDRGTVFYDDGTDAGVVLQAPHFDSLEPMKEVVFTPLEGLRSYSVKWELDSSNGKRVEPFMFSAYLGVQSSEIPDAAMTASTEKGIYKASRGRLDNTDEGCCWTPEFNNQDQWLQVDLAEEKLVIGVVTQGHCGMVDSGHGRPFGCVKKFHVQVSKDGEDFEYIKDEDDKEELFDSKCTFNEHHKNFFKNAVNVRYVRFIPEVWSVEISMRVEIIGRDDSDDEHNGVDLDSRSLEDTESAAVLFVDRPFLRNGFVSGLRYYAAMPESFVLGVWRPSEKSTEFSLVGRSYITSTGQSKVQSKCLSVKIPVRKNDVFGVVYDKQVIGSAPDDSKTVLILKNFKPDQINAMAITDKLDYPESANRKFSIRVKIKVSTTKTIAPVMSVTNMGIQDGLIRDDQITSNGYCDSNGQASRVRLGLKDQQGLLGGWCGRQIDQTAFIEINFKKKRPCGGVTTQGLSSQTRKWFVQKYVVSHTVDMKVWTDVADEGGNTIMFGGNFDQETQVKNYFPNLLTTQSIRIKPMKWNGDFPAMRMDVLGLADTVSDNSEVGFSTNAREATGSGGFSFVIPSKKFTSDGYLKGLYFRAAKVGSFKFNVFREINAEKQMYQVVGTRHIKIKKAEIELSIDFKGNNRLAVKKGDMIGFNFCRSVLFKAMAGTDLVDVIYARNKDIVNYRSMKAGSFVEFTGVASRSYSVKALFEAASQGEVVLPVDAKKPIGLANGVLSDTSITVSSTYVHNGDTRIFGARSCRLRHVGMHENLGGAWVPDLTDKKPWLQVDSKVEGTITGIITQGRHAKVNWWVTSYTVSYSVDCVEWLSVEDANGEVVFIGNCDSDTEVQRFFPSALTGKCLRVHPRTFQSRIAMRLEIIGDFETAANEYGMNVINRPMLDNKNFILLVAGISFESDGYITEWTFFPKASIAFKAGVWRAHPEDPFQFRHIGSNDIPPQKPGELATFQPDKTVQIPFRKGDVMGFSFTVPLIPFDEGEESTELLYSRNAGKLEPTSVGQYRRFESSGRQAYSITANVRIEPARDIPAVSCRHGLGMEDGLIPDRSIDASSLFSSQYTYSQARLNKQKSATLKGCWAPATDEADQYVQVDLGKPTIVTGVSVQGCNDEERWVTKFRVQLSLDGSNWEDALGTDGSKIFFGNTDSDNVVSVFFNEEAKVQLVRILVQEWFNQVGLRFEVMGCPIVCEQAWGANPLVRNWKRTQRSKTLVVNVKNPLTCNGYITGWKFVPKCRAPVIFYVLQPIDIKKGVFTIVGKTRVKESKSWKRGETVDVPLERADWIEVRSGQMIGFYSPKRSPIYKESTAHDKSKHMVSRVCKIKGFRRKSLGDKFIMTNYKYRNTTYSFMAVLSQEGVGDVKVLTPPIACSGGIGMETGRIPDESIFASSSNDPIKSGPGQARLNNDLAWVASPEDKNIYLQVDIGYVAILAGIQTQGDPVNSCWVTSYSIEYTAEHDYNTKEPTKFAWVAESNAIKEVYAGNSNQNVVKTNFFEKAIEARVIRFAINDFKDCPAMRMEILGCADPDTCNPNPCKNGALCRKSQDSGGYNCNCPSEWGGKNCELRAKKCFGWGDPHYGQFDGGKFNFQGDCTYVLTRTVSGSAKDAFEVTANNMQSRRRKTVSITREVFITINKRFYEFKQGRAVYVDHEKIRSPYEKDGVTIIDGSNSRVILKTDFGLRVSWDGKSKVDIHLTEDYMNEVEGLCGNYDGKPGKDFYMRNKDPTENIIEFGQSWAVDSLCKGCVDCREEDACRINDLVEEAQKACHVLINVHGPFSMCHAIIEVDPFYEDCSFDYCNSHPNMENLCADIQTYADMCIEQKIQIGSWRTPGFCNLPCPVGMVVTDIGTECPNTCGSPFASEGCTGIIGPMCVCAEGMLLEDGDRCVPIAECGCTYHGNYYKKGDSFTAEDCSESCHCNEEQEPECVPVDVCHEQASCSVVKGVRGCHCNPGWTGDGITICDEILEPVDVTICYDQVLTIDCSATGERIEILTVDYGSYQVDSCPDTLKVEHPGSQDSAPYVVSDRCNNYEKCSFTVNNIVFGNYAETDGKSLYVKYQCRQEVVSFPVRADTELKVCEGNTLELDCGFLKISVIRASYGRAQGDFTCMGAEDDTATAPLTEDCIFKSAFRVISEACHTKNKCTISSDTAAFGRDECPAVKKYGMVQYQCVKNPDPRVLEDDKCDPNPCINGECEAVSIEPKYNCKCNPGFTGTHCEIGKATCKGLGDPHYITFDDVAYDFMGPCRYTLVKNADKEVADFEIIVTNEKARRNPAMSSTVAVEFHYDNHVIKLGKNGVTYFDEVITNGYTSAEITIVMDTPNVVVSTTTGIVIRWDGRYLVEVDVTGDYFNHVEGLCGNYNKDTEDEFTTRLGIMVDDVQKFGRSWNVEDKVAEGKVACVDCVDCVLPEPCGDAAVKGKAQEVCGQLIDPSGPFQECHGIVDPEIAFKNCMTDMCSMPDGLAYCEDYQFYAEECNKRSITISWRRPNFCYIDCFALGMVYSPKSPACPSNCANPTAALTCNLADRENCVCPIGMLKEGADCVAVEECGCLHDGEYYKKGETVIRKDCLTVCSCKEDGYMECSTYSCAVNEYCGAKDGETLCLCDEKYFRDVETKKCLETPFPQTVVIPQDQFAQIQCIDRFINILDAHFGNPKQAEICLEVSGDKNCNAENSQAEMRRLCQNKEYCVFGALVGHFGEPCMEDFKYLHVEYSCEHKKTTQELNAVANLRVCLGQQVVLVCEEAGSVFIEEVFFGRGAKDGFCLKDGEAQPDVDHVSPNAIEVGKDMCNGKAFCRLTADTGIFGDPWVEGDEYMVVTYKCVKES